MGMGRACSVMLTIRSQASKSASLLNGCILRSPIEQVQDHPTRLGSRGSGDAVSREFSDDFAVGARAIGYCGHAPLRGEIMLGDRRLAGATHAKNEGVCAVDMKYGAIDSAALGLEEDLFDLQFEVRVLMRRGIGVGRRSQSLDHLIVGIELRSGTLR